jgi:hypothetical protein
MKSIKNRKPLEISKPNIIVFNSETREGKSFLTQKDAEEYMDTHQTPDLLECKHDKHFKKRRLKELEEIKNLNDTELEVLKLISLENPIKTISKIIEKDKKSICPIVIKLSKLLLISSCSKYGWKINESGENLLKKKELEW